MKNIFLKNMALAFIAIGIGVFLVACGGDEKDKLPLPLADFTVDIVGTTVTFTNTSTDGDTYSWNFGDGTTSTEVSPVHTYDKFAAYLVELTVTNASGSDTKSFALQVVAQITIDGDMSDWADIPALSTRSANNAGILTTVKAVSDLTNVYFYMESDNNAFNGFIQLYINADGDETTGWATDFDQNTQLPIHPKAGADFELDADAGFADLWSWTDQAADPDRYGWSFDNLATSDPKIYIPPMKSGNSIEFALVRAEFPGGLADIISFALGDVDVTVSWDEHGYLPNPGENYIELELFK